VEVGLHLELGDTARAESELAAQIEAFTGLYGRAPAYIDGHRHCHAEGDAARAVGEFAAARRLPVRSVDQRHRDLLRALGVPTADRLVGRYSEGHDFLPPEIAAVLEGGELPAGVTEWMVHPGHGDPGLGSSYDAGREEDLRRLLDLANHRALRRIRRTHEQSLRCGG
jgi:predicted glycoside hydrolase/deacetylase ChbG (UPF0249 family)